MTPQRGTTSAVYSVGEVCRILRPGMTPRRVHHWLHTGLIGDPIRTESQGRPTLLSFDQLVKIRVVQRLRDLLGFSLPRVRSGIAWILFELVEPEWEGMTFFRTGSGEIGVFDERGQELAIGGQIVLGDLLPELNVLIQETRDQWEAKVLPIEGFPALVSDAAVMGGSPVIAGTRVETAFVAHLGFEMSLDELVATFSHVSREALIEAIQFEGLEIAA